MSINVSVHVKQKSVIDPSFYEDDTHFTVHTDGEYGTSVTMWFYSVDKVQEVMSRLQKIEANLMEKEQGATCEKECEGE